MTSADQESAPCTCADPSTPVPAAQLLSNGSYHVMVTSAGGGYSRWKDLAVTRWRDDATCDNHGAFCYLRDTGSGRYWSTTYQPTLQCPTVYEAEFTTGRAAFRGIDTGIESSTEIVVAPDDAVELRRVRIGNGSSTRRVLELTSYAEIVLALPATDAAHPAFSKLFVETEILRERQAILCTRRPQAPGEPTPWMFHLLIAPGLAREGISYETDRMCFIGRGRTAADPVALDADAELSGSAGPVLDPVAAIRCRIAIDPGENATIDLITGIAGTREACMALVTRYQDRQIADRVLAAAPAHGQALLDGLHASASDAACYLRMAASVIYANASLRAGRDIVDRNREGQSSLWRYAISGDLPIVLLQIADPVNGASARQLVQAHAFWCLHGLAVDLVILAERGNGDQAALRQRITDLITAAGAAGRIGQRGGIFVLDGGTVPDADRILLQAVARVVIDAADGPLAQQLERRCALPAANPRLPGLSAPLWATTPTPPATIPAPTAAGSDDAGIQAAPEARERLPQRGDLEFGNGLGGFAPDGREYVITTTPGRMTPAPWVNVLANPSFGTLVSESGSATTWSENAQEFRLTPWSNDPIGDANTEAFYLRDEETGHYWSPTLLPCGGAAPHVARHGFGYSIFEHDENGVQSTLTVYVAIDAPVKFAVLSVRNGSRRARRLSVTGYLEWVLGDERTKTRMHVSTAIDPGGGALFARNAYNTDFAGRTAFFDTDEAEGVTACADRSEFLGRNGTLRSPAAMSQTRLSGTVGAALDPCAALRVPFGLAAGEAREIVFRLGAGASIDDARQQARHSRGSAAAQAALAAVKRHWQRTLSAVQIETPDRSLDLLANGWLIYQILASRLWARNAFYQSSGAFGFRDQLQDVMALVHAAPSLVREHLVRCASRQFSEGDVQHWWHPPSGRGVRTRCSDDYLWLPLAVCRYVAATGDTGVLDIPVRFLDGRALKDGEASYYDLPGESAESASLYEHCVRAITHGLRVGVHGLPLMGSGDWNDGMNLVGIDGKGESVWLAFFLYAVLAQFVELAQRRGDAAFAKRCSSESARLRAAIEQSSWDGGWYRRAWFDDGSPLGTAENSECRIDSIAQSWSVLSGAADAKRARSAMNAVDAQLVHRDTALIQLLNPPFDHSEPNPGYIQGYVRGVRENGGQYTHAAVWVAMAFAALDDAKRAWEMFAMINPINHAKTADAIAIYKTEPYVLASDVYALAPHTGRGGWTWYTGSAGWMYRFIVESLLGLRLEGDTLHFAPCVPTDWKSFRVQYRYRETVYHIRVFLTPEPDGRPRLTVDGVGLPGPAITMVDDGREHAVEVRIRAASG